MASICTEILITAPPKHVWAAVRDIGAVHRQLVPGPMSSPHVWRATAVS
jgi:hypothetical protein